MSFVITITDLKQGPGPQDQRTLLTKAQRVSLSGRSSQFTLTTPGLFVLLGVFSSVLFYVFYKHLSQVLRFLSRRTKSENSCDAEQKKKKTI